MSKCPNALLPDGPVCPRCGGSRAASGVDGGSWVHFPDAPDVPSPNATPLRRSSAALPENIRATLEASNLPIEVATAIADLCEQRSATGSVYFGMPAEFVRRYLHRWTKDGMETDYDGDWLCVSNLSYAQSASVPSKIEEAVRWILADAAYKAPELVGVVAERWIERLRDAMAQEGKPIQSFGAYLREGG